jgi:hypothetical protein
MVDYNNLVDKLFEDQENSISIDKLNNIIKQFSVLSEAAKSAKAPKKPVPETSEIAKAILNMLPAFEFNQVATGLPDTQERQLLIQYFGPIASQGATLQDKIKLINEEVNNVTQQDNGINAFRKLMILKILKNVIYNFYASSAGFNFEAFFAALMGGKQINPQVGNLTDVQVGNQKYQLKMLSRTRQIEIPVETVEAHLGVRLQTKKGEKEQSKQTLMPFVNEQGQSQEQNQEQSKELILVVGVKGDKGGIKFYESKFSNDVLKSRLDNSLKYGAKYVYIETKEYSQNPIGIIDVGDSEIIKLNEILGQTIKNSLIELSKLIHNVNLFYLNDDIKAGGEGIKNATAVSNSLKEQKQALKK